MPHMKMPAGDGRIELPGTREPGTAWDLYNQLIDAIPEDIRVTGWCLGVHWSYVEAECGMGVAWTASGGAPATFGGDLRGRSLREVAELAKTRLAVQTGQPMFFGEALQMTVLRP